MCGRFDLHSSTEPLAIFFGVSPLKVEPRYNIAPGSRVVALGFREQAEWLRPLWGFRANFSGREKVISNARRETVAEKPLFRKHLRRRVLVPANGFYEWRKSPSGSQPYYCSVLGEPLFCLAGLVRDDEDDPELTLLTTQANGVMRAIHHRMPVIIPRDHYHRWLDPELSWDEVGALAEPLEDDKLSIRAVSAYVNDARHEGPQCLASPRGAVE